MTPEFLKTVAEALYGSRWQSDLAKNLQVSDRTVRRWVAGHPVPTGLNIDLMRLCLERAQYLDDLAEELKRL